jgi:hypothetical protein
VGSSGVDVATITFPGAQTPDALESNETRGSFETPTKKTYIYIYIYYIYIHIYIYICIYIYKNISAENVDVEKYGQHGLQISLFHLACRFGMKPVSHQVRWLPATICAICDATASHFFPLDT